MFPGPLAFDCFQDANLKGRGLRGLVMYSRQEVDKR